MTGRGGISPLGWIVVSLAAVFVYLLVFKVPFTPFLNESDHHMFLYEGMRLASGDVMYRDFFQFTFPGCQLWYAAWFRVFGANYWILSATIVVIGAVSAAVMLQVSSRVIAGRMALLPVILFVFFGFRWDGLDGSHRMFSPIFVMLAIVVLLKGVTTGRSAAAGALCAGASFFTQQRGVYAVAAIAVFIILDGRNNSNQFRDSIRPAVALGAVFAGTLLLLTSFFIVAAGPGVFFDATIEYPLRFYSFSDYNNLSAFRADIAALKRVNDVSSLIASAESALYLFVLPASYLALLVLFFKDRTKVDWGYWRPISLVAIVGSALTFTTTAPNTSRMFQISMPGLIVVVWLVAHFGDRWGAPLRSWMRPAPFSIAGVVLFLAIVQAARIQTASYEILATPSGDLAYVPSPIIDERYKPLLQQTIPGDFVFEAYQPYIYFPLHLKNPSKYGQIWDSDYTRPEHVAETIQSVAAQRPRFILANNNYNKPDELRSPGDHTGPFSKYLLENYEPSGHVIEIPEGQIQIWARKN